MKKRRNWVMKVNPLAGLIKLLMSFFMSLWFVYNVLSDRPCNPYLSLGAGVILCLSIIWSIYDVKYTVEGEDED